MGWNYNVVMFVRLGKNRKGENQPPMRSITVDVLGSSQQCPWFEGTSKLLTQKRSKYMCYVYHYASPTPAELDDELGYGIT